MSLPFPSRITVLCKLAGVPISVGVDEEIEATKKFDIEKNKYQSRIDMRVQKTVPHVFRPVLQTGATSVEQPEASAGTTTPTLTQSNFEVRGKLGESVNTTSSVPQLSPFHSHRKTLSGWKKGLIDMKSR